MSPSDQRRTLIVGATSAIAQVTARLFAAHGDELFLVARDPRRLAIVRDDLTTRYGARVGGAVLDALRFEEHAGVLSEAIQALGGLDLVLIALGELPDQEACEASAEQAVGSFSVNALSVISLLTRVASFLEKQGHGTIVVITSVSGDRGRRGNYVYGSAKGAVSLFLQGLRSRMHRSGVRVVTIKPGLVDTPMTARYRRRFFWVGPERIARGIERAIRGSEDVVYLPWFWRWVMLVVRLLPERLAKRLSL